MHRSEICCKESLLEAGPEGDWDNQQLLSIPQLSVNHHFMSDIEHDLDVHTY